MDGPVPSGARPGWRTQATGGIGGHSTIQASSGASQNMAANPTSEANTITTSRMVPWLISRRIRPTSETARVIMSPTPWRE
ncbi:MAG: hypothetical protein U5R48_01030 [Gammaproteobacteria bacterium]|nr:hypothetical protein [Gammaproteobacteria bacterium]